MTISDGFRCFVPRSSDEDDPVLVHTLQTFTPMSDIEPRQISLEYAIQGGADRQIKRGDGRQHRDDELP
ncbi:hypothetical protein TNCV_665671 [Trichonephila clavipes]|uniref:Uncharacterized protein n=1 Tax=Trichonephila clavipes TaxID=2585209 RepID=A0A8X6SGS2_TRICX|nr:hypothetical protein TNCV_665671 [Trichonephila clavipes]